VLNDVRGLPATGFIKIDDEIINYGYITQNTNAKTGTLFNCSRGQQETIAVGHTAALLCTGRRFQLLQFGQLLMGHSSTHLFTGAYAARKTRVVV
jgi:hypothetical protein